MNYIYKPGVISSKNKKSTASYRVNSLMQSGDPNSLEAFFLREVNLCMLKFQLQISDINLITTI